MQNLTMRELKELWIPYFRAKEVGLKKVMKFELLERVAEIEKMDLNDREQYLDSLIRLNFDQGFNVPIQDPRIWKFILGLFRKKKEDLDPDYSVFLCNFSGAKGVYEIIGMEPHELLERTLKIKGKNENVAKALVLNYIDTLDFALHELPHALIIDREVCVGIIKRLTVLLLEYPKLKTVKNRFKGDADLYIKLFEKWDHYESKDSNIRFEEWNSL